MGHKEFGYRHTTDYPASRRVAEELGAVYQRLPDVVPPGTEVTTLHALRLDCIMFGPESTGKWAGGLIVDQVVDLGD